MFTKVVCWIFVAISLLIVSKYLFLLIFIGCGEYLRKKKWNKNKNDINNQTSKLKKNSVANPLSSCLFNFYKGCYRYITFKFSVFPSNHIRLAFYRHILHMKIGKKVIIHFRTEIRDGYKIEIGEGSIIGDNCILDGRNGIIIGKNVNISSNVSIYTLQHDKDDPYFSSKGGRVVIKDRSWVSSNSMILPGVSIGEGSVICGGAVATKNVEDFNVVAGIPAKTIAQRRRDILYSFDGKSQWFY